MRQSSQEQNRGARLSKPEGELYRIPSSPVLTDVLPYPDNVVLLAGQLRKAFDVCRATDDHLISVSTALPPVQLPTTK